MEETLLLYDPFREIRVQGSALLGVGWDLVSCLRIQHGCLRITGGFYNLDPIFPCFYVKETKGFETGPVFTAGDCSV